MGSSKLEMLAALVLLVGISAGVAQPDSVPDCTDHQEVIAVVDGSDSIFDEDFVKLKNALIQLAQGLSLDGGGQRFGAVVYSSSVSDKASLTDNSTALTTQIGQFGHPKQGTSTHLGIEEMTTMMREDGRPDVPKVGIVITDGRSFNATATQIAAEEARVDGIIMFAVGVGQGINTVELNNIASSQDRVLELDNFDQLVNSIAALVKKVCIINGGWSEWSNVTTTCSSTCGGGYRTITQTRTCTDPAPANGGKYCTGSSTNEYTETCNTAECPVTGGWSDWSSETKTECSATCGGGSRTCTKTRTCTNPVPQYGGADCVGSTSTSYTENCNDQACVVSSNPCDGCAYVNGFGYNPFPTDCGKYVHCLNYGANHVVMTCAADLHWSQDKLTCVFPSDSNCTDSTTNAPGGGGGGGYVDEPCRKEAVAGNNKVYREDVPGHGIIEMPCAAGTVFVLDRCTCDHGDNVPAPQVCQEEVYLPFNDDLNDHSGNHVSVQNEGVTLVNGDYASFTDNSGLRILRFSNMDFGNTLVISFLFHAGQTSTRDQAIVSNADCGLQGSIYIIQKSSEIEFRVRNKAGNVHILSLPYTTTNADRVTRSQPVIPVSLTVNAGTMTAKVGSQLPKSTAFTGEIARSHCAMQIGRGTNFDHFLGDLDEFKVYLCIP